MLFQSARSAETGYHGNFADDLAIIADSEDGGSGKLEWRARD